jgi:uncharacterized glyoxalase superfamily protein PhnB
VTRFARVTPRLPVTDLRPAIEFYTGVLGFKLGLLWPEDAPTFAILNCDAASIQFCLAGSPAHESGDRTTLCFDLDDVRSLYESLKERVAIEWGPEVYWYGRREFAINDPFGYQLIFSELTDDPPTCQEDG